MKRRETNSTGCDRRGSLAALRESVRYITRSCPAPVHVVVDTDLPDLFMRAGSVAGRGGQQGGHQDIESLGHGRKVVDRLPRPAPKSHGQRRLAQPHLGLRISWRTPRRAIQARTSAATLTLSSSTAVSSAARRQAVRSALARTRLADQVRFPPDASSPLSTPGCLLALIHSPLSHRLIDRYELHFMICIRIPAQHGRP